MLIVGSVLLSFTTGFLALCIWVACKAPQFSWQGGVREFSVRSEKLLKIMENCEGLIKIELFGNSLDLGLWDLHLFDSFCRQFHWRSFPKAKQP